MKSAREVRQEFLDYFRERGHTIVPSGPVYPKDDPTLLFTNAGMNQFKDVFLGTGKRSYTRAADTQKCIRVSGKHNDLEEVGRDTYHHTFFEMLGNWSFGDYFKRDAIIWSWELLTKVWGIPREKLWVTVFGGDVADGLPADDEAERMWKECTDVDPSHVLRFGRKDNFWEMGESGPCGPCTEIHIDRGGPGSNPLDGANRSIGVNAGNERFMEIWNNVFIQFNRRGDGGLEELPAKHVDTGMGFERVLAVLNGKPSNYETDLFQPIFRRIEELTGKRYGSSDSESDVAFRVIADHVRALTAALSDGALPGNEGRGYVLRRLLRRAARFGRQQLGMSQPFIHALVGTVSEVLGDAFPEMRARCDHAAHIIEAEEKAFLATLDKGLVLFEKLAASVERAESKVISGGAAYDLYATYGFPSDLVELMARERGLSVDAAGWSSAEAAHRAASRGENTGKWLVNPEELKGLPATTQLCHGGSGCAGISAAVRPLKLIAGEFLILERTPFYAESGGQVGDIGVVEAPGFRFEVRDTKKMGDLVVHVGALTSGTGLPVQVTATVDGARRTNIMANHTATHLMHWAMQQVLGTHATQQGSLVSAERLRFDVTHPKAITLDELERIEALVNARIVEAVTVQTSVEDLEAARARGVTALFGEKYDSSVRVVDVGGYSRELCGGTHCSNTGQIGAFVILSESAVQAGVRRIEAVTRGAAVKRQQEQRRLSREVGSQLKAAEGEILARILALQEQVKELKKGGAKAGAANTEGTVRRMLASAKPVGKGLLIAEVLEGVSAADVAVICEQLRGSSKPVCGVLGLVDSGKAVIAVFAAKELGNAVHSGDVVKAIASIVGGGGGGRPDFAQAGGKDPSRLAEAVEAGAALLTKALT
ncbi:MAG: alanine--tRNA ligase [Planctomycetes bacterium]|nr:alanine--tRNA ligase [Planctomycetota bacterium]